MSEMLNNVQSTLVVDACLLAGQMMLQSGAETSRVEDTMTRMAAACGVRAQCFVMPTGIILSTDDALPSKLARISDRSTDLYKVVEVNQISRQLSCGAITIDEAYAKLLEIRAAKRYYNSVIQRFAASITSGFFLLMFGGHWVSVLPAFLCGGLGFVVVEFVHRRIFLKFFAELTSSFLVGVLGVLFTSAGVGHSEYVLIVASVMPLVPGILITNAMRDLMAGHLVSGISKGAEAFLTAFAIGTGIAAAILVF